MSPGPLPQPEVGLRGWDPLPLTSRISLILVPAFPISEPHWLAGMTRRRVTGGLEMLPPFAVAEQRSWAGRLWVGRAHASAARLPWSPRPDLKNRPGLSRPSHPELLCGTGATFLPGNQPWPLPQTATDLVQLEGDHGDRVEDGRRRPGDGGDALGAGALGDGDPGAALRVQDKRRAAGGTSAFSPATCLPAPSTGPSKGWWKPPPSGGTRWYPQTVGFEEEVGQGSPFPSPLRTLTCSRIRFTVSPFCRRQNRKRLLA